MRTKPFTAFVGSVGIKKRGRVQTVWTAGKDYSEDDVAAMLNSAFRAGYEASRIDVAAKLNLAPKRVSR